MKYGLTEDTIEKFHSVFRKYPEIEEVIIYGFRAKGNYREGSDIDITLKGENLNESIRSKVWLDLDGLNTPYLIDLSVFHLTSESLINHIQKIEMSFYTKQ